MTLAVFWHPAVLAHETGTGVFEAAASDLIAVPDSHPESAERILNMRSILERGPLAGEIEWRDGRHATVEELETVHERGYIEGIRELAESGGGRLTPTTVASSGTFEAATAAAGTVAAASGSVLDREADCAYALTRPPGHHAQPGRADGYCFFNNVAVAAELALRRPDVSRVAIIDWDVHHGNGTQECFYGRGDVLTASLHMKHGAWGPTHPQTGGSGELGEGGGEGRNLNLDLPPGTGDGGYLAAMRAVVEPVVDGFGPDLIIIAAGQDPAQFDPNGRQSVSMDGFRALGAAARDLAGRNCEGRLVLAQEGGYAPTYAAFCLHATLEGALGLDPRLDDPLAFMPDDPHHADASIQATRESMAPFWPGLSG